MTRSRRFGASVRKQLADPDYQGRILAAQEIYDPLVRGALAHQAVQQTAVTGDWSFEAIRAVVRHIEPTGLPPIYRMNLRAFLISMVGSYASNFRRSGWQLTGYEMAAGPLFLDLLWATPEGLVADELKVGESYRSGIPAEDLAQVCAQCREGRAAWGEDFLGVRLLPLSCPDLQRWVRP